MMLVPDARRRVTLPPSFQPGQPVNLEVLEDGTFRLVPMIAIPAHQLWAWRPEIQASVEKSLEEMREGKGIAIESPEGQEFMRKLEGK